MFPPKLTNRIIYPARCRLNKWHRAVRNASLDLKKGEYLSLDQLYKIQQTKLRQLFENAANGCPYYQRIFSQAGIDPRKFTLDMLSNLPVLDKGTIRENFNNLINEKYPRTEISKNATGGSSGEPLVFYQSRHSRIVSAALALRGFETCGKKEGYPHVKLWGAPTDVQKTTEDLKKLLWNYLYNLRTIDAFNAGDKLFEAEYRNLFRNPPYLLESYSNILYGFGKYLQTMGKKPLSISAVISSAGVLYGFQRKIIQETISNHVFNRYGSREFGSMAHECEAHTGMHINMERFIIEIEKSDEYGKGDILVTDLENHAFPFIRYRIGDQGQITDQKCFCGRQSLQFKNVTGRSLDLVRTPSGRMISGEMFPHFFKDYPELIQGQVIQDTIDHIELRLKLRGSASISDISPLIQKIKHESNYELNVSVSEVQDLVINPTGKYRPVISLLE